MNEFTKEELQIIHLDINTEINKHRGILKPSPFHLALRDKVERMIENYCDYENSKSIDGFVPHPTDYTECNHEWENVEYATDAVTPTIICVKCKAIHFVRKTNDNQ